MSAPNRLDVNLQGMAAHQEAASRLKAGDPLTLERQPDGALLCLGPDGRAVGAVPFCAAARLGSVPHTGTVRSVRRQPGGSAAQSSGGLGAGPAAGEETPEASAAVTLSGDAVDQAAHGSGEAPGPPTAGIAAAVPAAGAESGQQQTAGTLGVEQPSDQQPQQQAVPPPGAIVALLVRFTPGQPPSAAAAPGETQQQPLEEDEEDVARLGREQFEQLAGIEEVRRMLRDERLQAVVRQVDAAPDREKALLRALESPNFKEFADKVLLTVAPEARELGGSRDGPGWRR